MHWVRSIASVLGTAALAVVFYALVVLRIRDMVRQMRSPDNSPYKAIVEEEQLAERAPRQATPAEENWMPDPDAWNEFEGEPVDDFEDREP